MQSRNAATRRASDRGDLGVRRRLRRDLRRFPQREGAGTRALFIVGGLVSIAFGVVLFSRPDVGAITLALLYGLFSLTYGTSQIVMGIQARRTGQTLPSAMKDGAERGRGNPAAASGS
jgi:hypothetical protein